MLSNAQTEKLALFFYFMFLDEVKAQNATIRAIRKIRRLADSDGVKPGTVVEVAHSEATRSFRGARATGLAVSSGHILLPKNSDWGPWFEFRKLSDFKEFEAVLLHQVLGFSAEEIAEGLTVPVGTIRYRVGHGLRQLGRIRLSGERHA